MDTPENLDRDSVPLIVDDVKQIQSFPMTRCMYFCIECDTPRAGWLLGLGQQDIPFLMLGLSGVVAQPSAGDALFDSPAKLERLFDSVEAAGNLYVGQSDVWMPNFVLQGESHIRGSVYRVGIDLFAAAFRFRQGLVDQHEFLGVADQLVKSVRFSGVETRAMAEWTDEEIRVAKQRYRHNRADYLPRRKS